MELKLQLAFSPPRYGVYETMLQVHGHHKLNLYMLVGMNWGLYYATILKLKENWIRCAFLYNYNCHKKDWF